MPPVGQERDIHQYRLYILFPATASTIEVTIPDDCPPEDYYPLISVYGNQYIYDGEGADYCSVYWVRGKDANTLEMKVGNHEGVARNKYVTLFMIPK